MPERSDEKILNDNLFRNSFQGFSILSILLLQIKKGLFHWNAATEPGKFAVVSDNAMTWNDNGYGIPGVCLSNGAVRFWISNVFSQFAI